MNAQEMLVEFCNDPNNTKYFEKDGKVFRCSLIGSLHFDFATQKIELSKEIPSLFLHVEEVPYIGY